jgi:aerobic carbon-monoxide dehydrogenase small subunit
MTTIQISVNGKQSEWDVEPRLLLVHFLREELGLTGTHIGCDTSQCGACTVRMNGMSVKSCTVLAVQTDGAEIHTIESLAAGGQLHPLQRAFQQKHGLQCGYCTPGFIMSAIQILERYPDADDHLIRTELDGNICRCTGYRGIVEAILAAAEEVRAARRDGTTTPPPSATAARGR